LLTALPLLAVGTMVGALALLPVFAGGRGASGDLILLVGLLEMPPLFLVLAGYASRSIYGEVGATREAIVGIVGNIPFLAAFVALATAAGSLSLETIVAATPWSVRIPALVAIVLCLPVKLRMNPFSLANAEQELLAGPLTEYDGRRLALWELAHGLEWVALAGTVAAIAVPWRSGVAIVDAAGFTALILLSVPVLTAIAAATGRFKLAQATRLLLRWPALAAGIAVAVSLWARHGGQ
jgi:NADH-quinone oxidoreductase subunit H